MKISNFNSAFNGNSQFGKTVKGSEPAPDYKPAYRKASGGEDFLEISDEAVKRHKEATILSFEDGRRRKDIHDAGVLINSLIVNDINRVESISDMIANGGYDFNDVKIIGETAERIIGFIG